MTVPSTSEQTKQKIRKASSVTAEIGDSSFEMKGAPQVAETMGGTTARPQAGRGSAWRYRINAIENPNVVSNPMDVPMTQSAPSTHHDIVAKFGAQMGITVAVADPTESTPIDTMPQADAPTPCSERRHAAGFLQHLTAKPTVRITNKTQLVTKKIRARSAPKVV